MRVLVTGGNGFLGKAIVQQLHARGDFVRVFSRGNYPFLSIDGTEIVCGDVKDSKAVLKAAQGMDAIIHTASKVGVWGDYEDYYQTNVLGTQAVLDACRTHKIRYLVYTSSPSVIYDGSRVAGANESLSYPKQFMNAYGETKAYAEQLIRAANTNALKTVSLRPHFIWGPEDNQLIPRIIAKAKSKRLRLIASEECLVDTVYIDNAAKAHILALDDLSTKALSAGKVYFISQDEPVELNAFINRILEAGGVAPVQQFISSKSAYTIGCVFEYMYKILRIKQEPPMTRFIAKQLSTTCWYDITSAKKDLGYQPDISIVEGLKRVNLWLASTNKV